MLTIEFKLVPGYSGHDHFAAEVIALAERALSASPLVVESGGRLYAAQIGRTEVQQRRRAAGSARQALVEARRQINAAREGRGLRRLSLPRVAVSVGVVGHADRDAYRAYRIWEQDRDQRLAALHGMVADAR